MIGANGENVGVVPTRQAIQMARDADLDLVEISPTAVPPVCRILDFGKFLFERTKKDREAKKAQTKIEIKEIRLRPKTNEAHRGFKVDDARRWLHQGHKVRVTVKFRGREMDYPEIALEDLKEIAQISLGRQRDRTGPDDGRAHDAGGARTSQGQEEGRSRAGVITLQGSFNPAGARHSPRLFFLS